MGRLLAEFKDHFSKGSNDYSKYRPRYPKELFSYLASICPNNELAWDCATGNAQAALSLVPHFKRVLATDASTEQLSSAPLHDKISYQVELAEKPAIKSSSLDLIVVAQALHWFNTANFFLQAKRTLKRKGVLAVWCYGLMNITPKIDLAMKRLYHDILGEYWSKERAMVEEGYTSIDFPFKILKTPKFSMEAKWSYQQLLGYLRTWSAVQSYKSKNLQDPIVAIAKEIKSQWPKNEKCIPVSWPLVLRVGIRPRN